MSDFLRQLNKSSQILFKEDPSKMWTNFRIWIGLKILPKDFSNFIVIILSKLGMEYEKLDSEQKDKISSLKIDFELRD